MAALASHGVLILASTDGLGKNQSSKSEQKLVDWDKKSLITLKQQQLKILKKRGRGWGEQVMQGLALTTSTDRLIPASPPATATVQRQTSVFYRSARC